MDTATTEHPNESLPTVSTGPRRYLTLSFDDGFRRSSLRTADLFEKHGLRAEFNVLAAPAHSDALGDFGL